MNSGKAESVRLTVALVIRRYDHAGGGAERWTHRHAEWLIRSGCRVLVVAERIIGAATGAEVYPVELQRRWYRRSDWDFAAGAAAVVEGLRPDITADMGGSWAGDVVMPHYGTRAANDRARLAMRSPLQRVLRVASTRLLPRRRSLASLERRVVGGGCRVVAVSSMTADHLHADLGIERARIEVVPNGVNLDRFRPPSADERLEARRALAIGDAPVALLVAHDFRLKGVDTAVRAVAELLGSRGGAPLLMVVGRDPARPIERLAARLGVAHLVRLVGPSDDVLRYYHAADVLVHPTYYDPCSLVALEAVACGLPVVTTAGNGAVERLGVGRECLVLDDPRNVRGLMELIAQAIEPRANESMRRAALERRVSLDETIPNVRLLELYRTLSGSRARAADPRDAGRERSAAGAPAASDACL